MALGFICSASGSISNRIGGKFGSIRFGTIFSVGKISAEFHCALFSCDFSGRNRLIEWQDKSDCARRQGLAAVSLRSKWWVDVEGEQLLKRANLERFYSRRRCGLTLHPLGAIRARFVCVLFHGVGFLWAHQLICARLGFGSRAEALPVQYPT